ncbi:hypothetical protein XSR1_50022 [Xenorhabdus szentirmaii DSM 16338]|uniref:Uncharacterized protein n=1 Tax=Xenorhabdus szentirmaii DSM 16338 TaxID=1427518 RepID=W1J1M4_9GAMM|nr:hypothetical protein XSR1_50022 [Xenorhabdus szentirmaii DSM 16338]
MPFVSINIPTRIDSIQNSLKILAVMGSDSACRDLTNDFVLYININGEFVTKITFTLFCCSDCLGLFWHRLLIARGMGYCTES